MLYVQQVLFTESSTLDFGIYVCFNQSGSAQESCDSLAYKTMMNAESLQSYMNMLYETRWLVVMGTKGTCKTSLASGISRHLSLCVGSEECEDVEGVEGGVGGEIISFNLDKEGMEVGVACLTTIVTSLCNVWQPNVCGCVGEGVWVCMCDSVIVSLTESSQVHQERPGQEDQTVSDGPHAACIVYSEQLGKGCIRFWGHFLS